MRARNQSCSFPKPFPKRRASIGGTVRKSVGHLSWKGSLLSWLTCIEPGSPVDREAFDFTEMDRVTEAVKASETEKLLHPTSTSVKMDILAFDFENMTLYPEFCEVADTNFEKIAENKTNGKICKSHTNCTIYTAQQ